MMRCSERAYAMCPTRHLCGSRNDATFTQRSECADFNRRIEDLPMTNAEKIRAMNDGELAVFLSRHSDVFCQYKSCCGELLDTDEGVPDEWCAACAAEWLKQPAEGV